jgi:hypothetical protein
VGYVIAAYAVVLGALVAYGVQLARERRRLGAALAKCPSHEQKANPG